METKNIYQKLSEFQSIVGKLRKDQKNPFYKSNYADLNQVLEMSKEPLKKVGLSFIQSPQITDSGLPYLETLLFVIENPIDRLISRLLLVLGKEDMMGMGSALTYARRYSLVTILGLEQEDDDGCATAKQSTKDFDPATEKVTFGKHKGKLWIDLPQFYLDWLLENGQAEAKSKAKKVMDIKPKEDNTDINDVIGEGYEKGESFSGGNK